MPPKPATTTAASGSTLLQPGDEFLDTANAAKFLDRSPSTLEYWRAAGGGPRFYKQGRRIRYLRSDLTKWALQQPIDVPKKNAAA